MSPAPHLAEAGKEQNCFSGHLKPAKPPHIFPLGAVLPPEGAAGGAGAGSGPELTTPLGVSTGIALALAGAVGGALAATGAAGVEDGACASAGGFEQPTAAAKHRNTTPNSIRFGFAMA